MSKRKYAIGDLFRENDRYVRIVDYGNSKGIYYIRWSRDPLLYDRDWEGLIWEGFEYRTEEELNKLEVVL